MLLLSTVALVMFHGLAARMGVVTGQGLIGLVRQRYGVRLGGAVLAALVVANVGTTCAEFAGIAAGFELFGHQPLRQRPGRGGDRVGCWCCAAASTASSMCCWCCRRCSSPTSPPASWPTPTGAPRPTACWCRPCPPSGAAIAIVTATVGTTLAPWGLSFIQSYAVDKKLRTEDLALERVDVVTGAVLTGVIGFFVVVACAATLHRDGRVDQRRRRRGASPCSRSPVARPRRCSPSA